MPNTTPRDTSPALPQSLHFGLLYARYYRRLLSVAAPIVDNHHDSEEVAHDVLLKAGRMLSERPTAMPTAELSAWLIAVTRRAALDRRRQATRARRRERQYALARAERQQAAASRETALDAERLVSQLRAALPEQSRLVELCLVEVGDRAGVARAMRIPRATLNVRVHRARKKLRQTLVDLLDIHGPPFFPGQNVAHGQGGLRVPVAGAGEGGPACVRSYP